MFNWVPRHKYDELELKLEKLEYREGYDDKISDLLLKLHHSEHELKREKDLKAKEVKAEVESYKGLMEQEYYHSLHTTLEEKFEKYENSLQEMVKSVMAIAKSVTDKFEMPKTPDIKVIPTASQNNAFPK